MEENLQHLNTDPHVDAVRRKFCGSRQALIAKGTEAEVYSLGSDRILKIYRSHETLNRQRDLKDFYQRAVTEDVTFALPRIFEVGSHGSVVYSVEQRLAGVPMAELITSDRSDYLPALYLNAVFEISRIRFAPAYERRTLSNESNPMANLDWNAYVRQQITKKVDALRATLPSDALRRLGPLPVLTSFFGEKYAEPDLLIHGDFHPGNVLIDGGEVSAVIDFGTFTTFGDPLYDIATACGFYSMYEDDQLLTRARLLEMVSRRVEPTQLARINAYLLYAALTTCDLYPDDSMPIHQTGHFQWAMSVLADEHLWATLRT